MSRFLVVTRQGWRVLLDGITRVIVTRNTNRQAIRCAYAEHRTMKQGPGRARRVLLDGKAIGYFCGACCTSLERAKIERCQLKGQANGEE